MTAPSPLPKRNRGRQSFEAEAEYREQFAVFCTLIRKIESKWISRSARAADVTSSNAMAYAKVTLARRTGSSMSAAAPAFFRSTSAPRCEANALVVEPEVGRALCRDAILEHIPPDAVERYEHKLDRVRKRLRRALRERVS
jgi:hypothetical protein